MELRPTAVLQGRREPEVTPPPPHGVHVHFHPSPPITLKDVSGQHGRVRGFAQEPAVVEVSLNLQKDQIAAEKEKSNNNVAKRIKP